MSLAVGEALLAGDLTPRGFAQAFVTTYRRDPRLGYSRGFQALLDTLLDGDDLLARIRPDSERSGAAMRAGCVGLLPEEADVLRVAEIQARVTHDTPGGVASAQAAALMVHALRWRRTDRAELPEWLAARVPGPWTTPWTGPVGETGMDSVRAALESLVSAGITSNVLRLSVAWTGDVDTVAAIAMAAASQDHTMVDDVPEALRLGLEDGPFGRTFLARVDARLEEAFPAPRG